MRGAAAAALAAMRGDDARDVLVRRVLDEDHPRARRALVKALGELRGSTAAAAVLVQLIEQGDRSYFVEAEACLSLGRLRAPEAPATLRKASARDSYLDVIRSHCWRGLAEARDDSAFDVLIGATAWAGRRMAGARPWPRWPCWPAAAATATRSGSASTSRSCSTTATSGSRSPRSRRCSRSAIRARSPRSSGRSPARSTAGSSGAPREVIRDLGEQTGTTAEVNRLRDELSELRTSTAGLRDRLDRLEARSAAPVDADVEDKKAKKAAKEAAKAARKHGA